MLFRSKWLGLPVTHRPRRVALRYVGYLEADRLIREDGWTVAPEEDENRVIGMVFMEKRE